MTRGKSLLIGFIIGGAVSATTVLLSTPSSGRSIRSNIKQQSLDWKDLVNKLTYDASRLKDQISKTSKDGVALINELTKDMMKSVEEWKVAVEPHQDNIQEYLKQIETSLKELEQKVKND